MAPKKHSDGSAAAGMGTSLSTNVAAASTTAVYKRNYGSPDPSLTVTEDGDAGDFSDDGPARWQFAARETIYC